MKKSFSLMTVMALLLPSFVFGQSAKDAYKAFKKIEANTEIGISSNEYSKLLADAKFEFNLYAESPGVKVELKEAFANSFNHYKIAKEYWDLKLANRHHYYAAPLQISSPDSPYDRRKKEVLEIIRSHPELNKPLKEGGIIVQADNMQVTIDLNRLIQCHWIRASEELQKISTMLSQ
jgi:hypothetical protein